MKRFLCTFLAVGMLLTTVSFALTEGYIYKRDDGLYDDDQGSTLAPGTTAWVFLENYTSGDTAPKSVKLSSDIEFLDADGRESKRLVTIASTAKRLKYASNPTTYGWFAELKVKSISTSSYEEDGYEVVGADASDAITYRFGGSDKETALNLDTIAYEDGSGEFGDDLMLYTYEKDDDVDIESSNGKLMLTGVARRDFDVVASLTHDPIDSLLNKYSNADLEFYIGNGASFPISNGKITIEADSRSYLYSIGANNTLTDRSSTWKNSEGAFIVNTNKLDSYVVSDTKLNASSGSSSTVTPSTPPVTENIGEYRPAGEEVLINPSTGAAV